MEVCGTGDGDSWVGYRQRLGYNERDYCVTCGENYVWCPSLWHCCRDGPTEEHKSDGNFHQLGSTNVLPAVRAVEAIIHSQQLSAPVFSMHVNGCENCLNFAQYVPRDIVAPCDEKTDGLHTCMVCGKARYLCLQCVGDRFHSCAEKNCPACVCVECDGGRSLSECYLSGEELEIERMEEEGTTYFDIATCCLENLPSHKCRFPQQFKILCKDKSACCGPTLGPD